MKYTLIKELTKTLFQATGNWFWAFFFFVVFTGMLITCFYLKYWKGK